MPNVWYIGHGSREITVAQWAQVGITAVANTWDANNGWSIDQSAFTSPQLNLLDADDDFLLGQTGPRSTSYQQPTIPELNRSNEAYYIAAKAYVDDLLTGSTLSTAISGKQNISEKNQANGYAGLDGSGKLPANLLPATVMEYQGTWNASTNSPTLADGTGSRGDWYRVTTAGTRDLGSGSIVFDVGDYAIHNGSTWEKSDTTDSVASVAGLTGTISSGSLKTALSLAKADVGLSSVDNTSDASKNSAAVTLTNKALTAPKIDVICDANGNNAFGVVTTASAVNYLQVTNAASGNSASLSAVGSGTNLDVLMVGKGTGVVKAGGVEVVTISGTQTLTNKTLNLASNTLTGTTAQFNTALSDGDFVTLNGTETLTNKTLTSPTINTPAIANATSLSVGTSTNSGTTTPKCVNLGGTYGTNTAGTSGNQKINLLNDGTNVWGIGVGSDRIEYQSGSGTSHRFYIGGVEALRIFGGSGTGLQAFGVDMVSTTAAQTLTNKTLTAPKVNAIQNSAGNTTISLGGSASAVNYVFAWSEATGGGPQLAAGGTDTNINLLLYGKGTGVVKANGIELVGISSTQTLTNKTLTNPKVNDIYDTNGSKVLSIYPWGGTLANFIQVAGTPSGTAPTVKAAGSDANVGLNLITTGTGVVRANNVDIVTISGTQTLTNKTLTTPTMTVNDGSLTLRSTAAPTQTAKFDLSDIWAGGPALMRLPMNSSYTSYMYGGSGTAPATAGADGVKGQMEYDANYWYVCVNTNTWKRAALSTW